VVPASCIDLPFKAGAFKEVRAIHMLEHLTRWDAPKALREFHRVLAPGGALYVEVPDFLASINMIHMVMQLPVDETSLEEIRLHTVGMYGKQRHPGDYHHWGYNIFFLTDLIRAAGSWGSITEETDMISKHCRAEPVILIKSIKAA
jgi:predicted SAM-dependent methyltransferase